MLTVFTITMSVFGTTMKQGDKAKKARGLVEKALVYLNTHNLEDLIKKINEKDPQFVDGEFYLFLQNFEGNTLAHGGNVKLVNRNVYRLKDPDGVYFMQEFIKTAKKSGTGWVEYRWANPVTGKIQAKNTYIARIKGKELLIGCGYYK